MPPTRVPRCGALVVVVAVLAHPAPRPRRACGAVAAPATSVPCARVERAAAGRGRVPASMEPCARVARAAAVCSRRWSGGWPWPCARVDRAAVLVAREPPARAPAPSAAVPSTRERYAGAVGAVSEWWTCLRRACRTDR
nr:MAG TPA: hypothetical protein [Caudoviricetes sp.]